MSQSQVTQLLWQPLITKTNDHISGKSLKYYKTKVWTDFGRIRVRTEIGQ